MFGLILTPAGERDYSERGECVDDWESGKGFRVVDGPLVTIADVPLMVRAGFNVAVFTNKAGDALLDIDLIPNETSAEPIDACAEC